MVIPGRRPGHPPAGRVTRGDGLLLLGLLAALAIAASASPIRNYDYWWHLATGRLILERHAVPRADPFSFAAAGVPWIDHEWLFEIAAYVAHAAAGEWLLVLLKVAAVSGLGFLAASRLSREGHGPAGMAVLLAPALLGAAFRLDVRPELSTLLLVPLAIHLALGARDAGSRRRLAALPAITALGANLHAGILLLPFLLALGAVATWITERVGARNARGGGTRRFAGALGLSSLASGLACGVNPYGYGIVAVPWRLSRILASLPAPNLEWARPQPGQFPLFYLAGGVFVVLLMLGRRTLDPIAAPATFAALALGAVHLRNVGLFFLLLPYGAARPARALVERLQTRPIYRLGTLGGRARPGFIAAAVVLAAAIPLLTWLPPWPVAWGFGTAPGNEPAPAVDFLEREAVGRRLFNDVLFGGYLIWRRYPAHLVFIDGRNEIYPVLLRSLFAALGDSEAWSAFLDHQGIDAAMLRYPPALQRVVIPAAGGKERIVERSAAAVRFPKERWALVYWDDEAMIVVRRGPPYQDVTARLEYKAIHPDDWRYDYAAVLTGQRAAGPVLEELRRRLREDPGCGRARELLRVFTGLEEGLRARPAEAPARPR
jgi:hypothetical protein